jgi:uncharacterized protein YidB (DUF937 family)
MLVFFTEVLTMGLFDSVAGQVLGSLSNGAGAGGNAGLVQAVTGMLASYPGGLPGLVAAFQEKGLGGVVASWIGTGENLPISAEQIQAVLGSEQVQAIAQALGFSPQQAAGKLAEVLPGIVDGLTPGGTLPQGNPLGGLLGGLLKG